MSERLGDARAGRQTRSSLLQDHALSLALTALFLLGAAGQVWTGLAAYDDERAEDGSNSSDEDPEAHRGDPAIPWPVRRGGLALKRYQAPHSETGE